MVVPTANKLLCTAVNATLYVHKIHRKNQVAIAIQLYLHAVYSVAYDKLENSIVVSTEGGGGVKKKSVSDNALSNIAIACACVYVCVCVLSL